VKSLLLLYIPPAILLVVAVKDGSWSFTDIPHNTVLKKVESEKDGVYATSIQFHPDGLILATGLTNGSIKVWDIRQQNIVGTLRHTVALHPDAADISVSSISFSENGYFFASSGNVKETNSGSVNLWDLRKLECTKFINGTPSGSISNVSFDISGQYLAIACGLEVMAYAVKEWSPLTTITSTHSKPITSVAWNRSATALFTAGGDRHVKTYQ